MIGRGSCVCASLALASALMAGALLSDSAWWGTGTDADGDGVADSDDLCMNGLEKLDLGLENDYDSDGCGDENKWNGAAGLRDKLQRVPGRWQRMFVIVCGATATTRPSPGPRWEAKRGAGWQISPTGAWSGT